MQSQPASAVSSTKVSDGLYVVNDAYSRIYDFFETSPVFPTEPLMVATTPADDKQAGPRRPATGR
jgi:hypothetical protein